VTSNGARAWILGVLEAAALFDGPGESADELDSLGAVGQQCGYVGTGDSLLIEPLNKMSGSRVSSLVIAVADTTSLLLGESSVESVQSRDSGGRQAVQCRRLEHCCMTDSQVEARLTGCETQSASSFSSFPGTCELTVFPGKWAWSVIWMRKRERRRAMRFLVRAECCSHERAEVLSARRDKIHPPRGAPKARAAQRTNQMLMTRATNSRMLMWSPSA
jgi:hypothetical protein